MNHLLAKTKGRHGNYYKVISNQEIFTLPDDLANHVEYEPSYILEDDEWFGITDFSDRAYCIDFLTQQFVSAEYDQIATDDYQNIHFLCAYQNDVYFLQKISASQVLNKKWLSCSAQPTLSIDQPIIVIDNYPDAIYVKSDDILYFKNLSSITGIFNGIDQLYREATQQETEEFIANDFIQMGGTFSVERIKKANRKRIALAMQRLEAYTPQERTSICEYINGYCDTLPFNAEDGIFTISTEDELKLLLWGIDQRYYTTQFGNERRVANSIRQLV